MICWNFFLEQLLDMVLEDGIHLKFAISAKPAEGITKGMGLYK